MVASNGRISRAVWPPPTPMIEASALPAGLNSASPSAPLAAATIADSVTSCRMMRHRLAPMAIRTASSFCRSPARAN